MISVKIDFQLKCMNCLYEESQVQSRTWTNRYSNSDSEVEVSYEQASTMLSQLLFDVTCKKCRTNDQLGFLILKANNKIFNTINPKQETKTNPSAIHNSILDLSHDGLVVYYIKDEDRSKVRSYIIDNMGNKDYLVASLTGIRTENSTGSKSYELDIYFDFDVSKPIHEQGKHTIDPDDSSMGVLDLDNIKKVARFATFKELGWM